MTYLSTLLAGLAVALVLIAVVAVLAGEPLLGGLSLLVTALVIYFRETRT